MRLYCAKLLSTLVFLLGFGFAASPARAQISTDSTLSTHVSASGTDFTITDGDRAGNNLFHSFSEFSIPTNGSAIFENSTDVENIFSRVTGSTQSSIDGIIRANGTANMFLLNPNGIIFGDNAALDLNGSFLSTTASEFVFENGLQFGTNDLQAPPLLAISAPIGLQFGTSAADITNYAQTVDASFGDVVGLQVDEGQTISLVSGPIWFENGHLTAPGGAVNLGSVAAESYVGIGADGQVLDYKAVEAFQDIHLTQGSRISASGEGGGRVQIRGRQITVDESASIWSETLGDQDGQDLILQGSEQILISATAYDSLQRVVLSNSTMPGSTGKGGNLILEAPSIQVKERAWIFSSTMGEGEGGDMLIQADTFEAISGGQDDFSFIYISAFVEPGGTGQGGNFDLKAQHIVLSDALVGTGTAAQGSAGDVNVEAGTIALSGGAQLQTLTFGEGDAGEMTIQASESIDLTGVTDFLIFGLGTASSGLFASAEPGSTGNSGTISVETPQLRITEGGKIAVNALGSGDGGDVYIHTETLEVSDPVVDFAGGVSGIIASAESSGTGNSGSIYIETDRFLVFDGGQILSSAFGDGQAGDITVLAKEVEVTGASEDGTWVSRIAALSESELAAGSVTIEADTIRVSNSAEIDASNQGTGEAGNLQLVAQSILLDSEGRLISEVNGGSQGNISLAVGDALVLRNGSSITTNAAGASTGGNISIRAGFVVGVEDENSDISANSESSFGGRVTIVTDSILGLQYRPQSTPLSDITASSSLGAAFSGTVDITIPSFDPVSDLIGLPTTLADSSDQIAAGCSSQQANRFVATGRGGLPISPNEEVYSDRLWQDTRTLSISSTRLSNAAAVSSLPTSATTSAGTARSVTSPAAQSAIQPSAQPLSISEATAWRKGASGQVEFVSAYPVSPNHSDTCMAAS